MSAFRCPPRPRPATVPVSAREIAGSFSRCPVRLSPSTRLDETQAPFGDCFLTSCGCAWGSRALVAVAGKEVITVSQGADLQHALDRARPGDTIVLNPGVVYTGNFVLPN